MEFDFVETVPPINGRIYLDTSRLHQLLDALIDNPGQWAKVPITFFYPDLEGADKKKLINKARSIAARTNKGHLPVLSEYRCEAKSRGTDVYMRITLTRRQLAELGLD